MTTSYSFKLKARPGENNLLFDHLVETAEACREKVRTFSTETLLGITQPQMQKIAYLMGLGHDLGKATKAFQRRLEDPSYAVAETHHALLSALFTWDLVSAYGIQEGIPEQSLRAIASLVFLAVKCHHGSLVNVREALGTQLERSLLDRQLDDLHEDELGAIINCGATFLNYTFTKNRILEITRPSFLRNSWMALHRHYRYYKGLPMFLLHKYLFSILTSSDKETVIFGEKQPLVFLQRPGELQSAVEEYKRELPSAPLNEMREKLYYETKANIATISAEDRILSLNMPTGTGKTLTALAAALQIQQRFSKEGLIVYCLPFTSIIDQSYEEYAKIFEHAQGFKPTSTQLLKHHHLAEKEYVGDENQEWSDPQQEYLIETWQSQIVVTTFVQFFESLAGKRNRLLLKLQRIQNAVIILDEVQAVPIKYWDFIQEILLTLVKEYNCHLLLVTATLPLIFTPNEVKSLIPEPKKYFHSLHRTRLILRHRKKMCLEEFYREIDLLIRNNPNSDILIVLNTIASATAVYEFVARQSYLHELVFLSTYVVPKVRIKRIHNLRSKGRPKIIVSTQLVEAGVNISVDLVIRDFGPLDSINQVAGRTNRHGENENPSLVYIYQLVDENGNPYAKKIYDVSLLSATMETLADATEISEEQYWELNQAYYKCVSLKRCEYDKDLINQAELLDHCEVAKNFKLIEELPKLPVFVELDSEAQELWKRYKDLNGLKDLEKRRAFAEFKIDFSNFVVNVTEKDAGGLTSEGNFYYVPNTQIDKFYDEHTGFKKGVK